MTQDEFVQESGLSGAPKLVWIVEDDRHVADGLDRLCRSLGHPVVAMSAIRDVKDGIAYGVELDGEGLCQVDLSRVNVAFLDFQFSGSDGAQLARALAPFKPSMVVAMSSDSDFNARILKAGGHQAILKGVIRQMLASLNV